MRVKGLGVPKTCSVSNRDAVHHHIVRCRVSPQYEMLCIIILCYTHHSPLNVEGSVVAQAEAARRRGTRGCRAPLSRLRASEMLEARAAGDSMVDVPRVPYTAGT